MLQAPPLAPDFLAEELEALVVVVVESEGSAPEAAVDVGGFVSPDYLRLAGPVYGRQVLSGGFAQHLANLCYFALAGHVVEEFRVEGPATEASIGMRQRS